MTHRIFAVINEGMSANCLTHKAGTIVIAPGISPSSSPKNSWYKRVTEMHQTPHGNHWQLEMKALNGLNAESSSTNTVQQGTATNFDDEQVSEQLCVTCGRATDLPLGVAKYAHKSTEGAGM